MSEKIAFIADSCADLPEEIRKRENVFIVHLSSYRRNGGENINLRDTEWI